MKKLFFIIFLAASSLGLLAQKSNRLDYVGKMHNEILNYSITNLTSKSSFETEIKENVIVFFEKDKEGVSKLFEESKVYYTEFKNAEDRNALYQKYGFSLVFCVNADYLIDLYANKKDDKEFESSLATKIQEIEASNELNEKEKDILLSAVSTIIHSNRYWNDDDKIKKWASASNATIESGKFWATVGGQDLNGAIQGGVAGAIVGGTVATPLGAAPAWVVGAVSWGAGCSVAAAVGWLTGWW